MKSLFKGLLSILWLFPLAISGLLLVTLFITPSSVGAAVGITTGRQYFYLTFVPLVWLSSVLLLAHLKVSKVKGRRYQKVKFAALILTSLVLIEAGYGYNYFVKHHRGINAPDGTATSVQDAERAFKGPKVNYTPKGFKAMNGRFFSPSSLVVTYLGPKYKKPALNNPKLIQTYQDSYEVGRYKILPGMENQPCTRSVIDPEVSAQLDTCVADGDYHYYEASTDSINKLYLYDTQGYRVTFSLQVGSGILNRDEIDKIIKSVR